MWGSLLAVILAATFIIGLASGTVGWLLLTLTGSVTGALIGAALHWSEPAIYASQMAFPVILLTVLLASAVADRITRHRERQNVYRKIPKAP
jgi:hypothetical protein